MKKPTFVSPEASAFYDRHAKTLKKEGLLTPRTHDTFVLTCLTWGRLNEDLPVSHWCGANKQFQTLAALFGMTPASRKKLGLDEQVPEVLDSFGI